ncbi:hypothetical protein GCM10022223_49740 [Kineosporia mesophila]|uniref:Uncharacterized protein n=1 Tax=Kineosporia mesophila TaxID=566012 RepID=A0ABP7A7I3_9ACTN
MQGKHGPAPRAKRLWRIQTKSEPAGPYSLGLCQFCPPKGYCAGASEPESEYPPRVGSGAP